MGWRIIELRFISYYFASQIFNKSLLAKFAWAMDVDPDFRFWYFELILSWPQHPLSPHLKKQKKKKKKTEVHFVLSFPIKDINIFLVSSGKFDVVCTSNLIMGRVTPFLTFFFLFFFSPAKKLRQHYCLNSQTSYFNSSNVQSTWKF